MGFDEMIPDHSKTQILQRHHSQTDLEAGVLDMPGVDVLGEPFR